MPRAPQRVSARCPGCEAVFRVEPSGPVGDLPCPGCGLMLWFVLLPSGVRPYPRADVSARKRELIAAFVAVGPDSLDVVELVMELEEEFEITIPDEQAEKIKTVGEAIDYIERELAKK